MRSERIYDFQFQSVNEQELIARTKRFALRVMKVVRALPKSIEGRVIADQLMRSGTSVAANYRAACKARSRAEFISKLGTVEEEADETASWIELLIAGNFFPEKRLRSLLQEAEELVAIFAASRKSAAQRAQLQIANRKLEMATAKASRRSSTRS